MFSIVHQQALGTRVPELTFTLADHATGGAVLGLLLGVYEVEWRMSEEKLMRERETAELLNDRLSVLNRVLRHDIRTNVNIIQGYAESMLDDTVYAYTAGRIIREKSTELYRMSENARLIERTMGSEVMRPVATDLAEVVTESVGSIERRYPFVELDATAPTDCRIRANELAGTAVRNLLENAVVHNDKETPVVSVDVVAPAGADGAFAEVRIADNGPGMPEGQMAVLERGHETDLEHSNGLGLWLANWIVHESDGELRFGENDPVGTVVAVSFPLADGPRTRDVPPQTTA
ncbi:MAG: sensor histidine kinase [Salinigranum sp.]